MGSRSSSHPPPALQIDESQPVVSLAPVAEHPAQPQSVDALIIDTGVDPSVLQVGDSCRIHIHSDDRLLRPAPFSGRARAVHSEMSLPMSHSHLNGLHGLQLPAALLALRPPQQRGPARAPALAAPRLHILRAK